MNKSDSSVCSIKRVLSREIFWKKFLSIAMVIAEAKVQMLIVMSYQSEREESILLGESFRFSERVGESDLKFM